MLYRFLRFVCKFALGIFYRRITVVGEPYEGDQPLVIAANHANALMDPALLYTLYKRRCHFMATAQLPLFKWPLKWLGRAMSAIPVYRKRDGKDPTKNVTSFEAAHAVLEKNGAVVIFPARLNRDNRQMPDFATGCARIALGAEGDNNFELGTLIQPIGINYGSFHAFRSSVTIVFGKPIRVGSKSWKERYAKDSRQTVRDLTQSVRDRVSNLVAQVNDPENEELIEKLARLYEAETPNDFDRIQGVSKRLAEADLKRRDLRKLEWRVSEYLDGIDRLQIPVGYEKKPFQNWALGLLSLPFVLAGIVLHFVPYVLSGQLVRILPLNSYHHQTAKFLAGLILTGLWYLGAILTLHFTIGFGLLQGLALIAAVILGALAVSGSSRVITLLLSLTVIRFKYLRHLAKEGEKLREEFDSLPLSSD